MSEVSTASANCLDRQAEPPGFLRVGDEDRNEVESYMSGN